MATNQTHRGLCSVLFCDATFDLTEDAGVLAYFRHLGPEDHDLNRRDTEALMDQDAPANWESILWPV